MKVIVIGGGPAGMLAAISAGMNKDDVTILDLDEPSYFELGYSYVDMMGGTKELANKTLEYYFDYETFGRDLVLAGEFTITKDGKGVNLI